jgi:urea transport system permease protein
MSALARMLPARTPTPSGFAVRFALAAAGLLLLAPAVLSDFRLSLLAKFLCFAIIAVGIGLAWGQGGMLVLGQGLFFGLGGYCMGMHMKIVDAGAGNLPDILTYSGKYETLPALWKPFTSAWFAVPMAIGLPMAIAGLLGAAVFRQRIRGAYFAILSQALAGAFVIVIVGNLSLTGGTNGLTNFQTFFGLNVTSPADQRILYFVVAITLLIVFLLTRALVISRYGRLLVASRDDEDRVRFLGYDPARVKLVAYVLAAGMAGLAGALFVPVVGIISPALLGIVPSIEMVIWVALGGRTALAWAAAGAVIVNWAKSSISEQFPSTWLYLQGLLFVVVILFLPNGVAGAVEHVRAYAARIALRRRPQVAPGQTAAAAPADAARPPIAAHPAAPEKASGPPHLTAKAEEVV